MKLRGCAATVKAGKLTDCRALRQVPKQDAMTHAEATETTLLRFLPTYEVSPQWLKSHLISLSNETNRRPDPWHYETDDDNDLADPITKGKLLDIIARIEGTEYEIAQELNSWQKDSIEGIAFWVSPKLEGMYPCNKVIIHRIAYTPQLKKVVLNCAVLFDGELDNSEALRQTLFTAEDSEENIFSILKWIGGKSKKQIAAGGNGGKTQKQAEYYARRFRQGVPAESLVLEMRQSGFIGGHSISCAGGGKTLSGIVESRSSLFLFSSGEDNYGSLEFSCPKCGSTNTRPFGQLISNCAHCGADVRC